MNIAPLGREATLEDLYEVEGRAELVDGQIVLMSPNGYRHGKAAHRIRQSLDAYQERHGGGYAVSEASSFVIQLRGPRTFTPDAAWWIGREPEDDELIEGAPAFAAEVRSKSDYGLTAERAMAIKRADYFAGGTKVVWDIDRRGRVVHVYRADDPNHPNLYRSGDVIDAEPAVPGWTMLVDDIFR
jgi:Uma2 family endonuclease